MLASLFVFILFSVYLFSGFLFEGLYSDEVEHLSLNYTDELGFETSFLEKNNRFEEVEIDTFGEVNLDFGDSLYSIAISSCLFYQGIFFEDGDLDLDLVSSDAEEEYMLQMFDFIGDYDISEVSVEVSALNSGFACKLFGSDKNENLVSLVDDQGSSHTLNLAKAEEQYI